MLTTGNPRASRRPQLSINRRHFNLLLKLIAQLGIQSSCSIELHFLGKCSMKRGDAPNGTHTCFPRPGTKSTYTEPLPVRAEPRGPEGRVSSGGRQEGQQRVRPRTFPWLPHRTLNSNARVATRLGCLCWEQAVPKPHERPGGRWKGTAVASAGTASHLLTDRAPCD